MLSDLFTLELIMVILTCMGIFARKKGMITEKGRECLTDILTEIILPCNIFLSFLDGDAGMLMSFIVIIVISVFVMLFVTVLGKLCYGRMERERASVFRYGLINSNAMFIGMPVIQSLLGAAGVVQQSMYMIFARMYIWSYGLTLFTGAAADIKATVKKLFGNSCMIAAILGLVVMLTGISLPSFVQRTLQYCSSCMILLSMLLVGEVLADMDVRQIFRHDVWIFSVIRLVLVPAVVYAACRTLNVEYIVMATSVLLSGMPAASLSAILPVRYGMDAEVGAITVAVSTVLSMFSIPLWYVILQL